MLGARRGLRRFAIERRQTICGMNCRERVDNRAQTFGQRVVRKFLIRECGVAADVRRRQRIQHRQLRWRRVVRHVRMPVLIDVFRLAAITQLDQIRVCRHPGVRMSDQRAPATGKRHLVFGRELLCRKRQHVVFAEKRVQRLPRDVIDMANVDPFDDRSEWSCQTPYAHDAPREKCGWHRRAGRAPAPPPACKKDRPIARVPIRCRPCSETVSSPAFRRAFQSSSWRPSSFPASCSGVPSRRCSSSGDLGSGVAPPARQS